MENTFIFFKPDAIERKLIGKIITKIEDRNLKIIYLKKITMTKEQAIMHYAHTSHLLFFSEMIEYYTSNPILVAIVEGKNAIKEMRALSGSAVNPIPGTIRADFASYDYKNLIHTCDCLESFKNEVNMFLPEFTVQI